MSAPMSEFCSLYLIGVSEMGCGCVNCVLNGVVLYVYKQYMVVFIVMFISFNMSYCHKIPE